jgi:hypothetical protein
MYLFQNNWSILRIYVRNVLILPNFLVITTHLIKILRQKEITLKPRLKQTVSYNCEDLGHFSRPTDVF